jgi:pyridoxine/pyridoxamine 5'-phosphate oxidase
MSDPDSLTRFASEYARAEVTEEFEVDRCALATRQGATTRWASQQSAVLNERESLDAVVDRVVTRFENVSVARPPFWGGYRIAPSAIEFWYGMIVSMTAGYTSVQAMLGG